MPTLSLRTPPVDHGRPGQMPSHIAAPIFPAWFVCEQVELDATGGDRVRRRRLVRWQDLDTRGGRRKFIFDDGKRTDVTPIRFVCACKKGHMQDIDWRWMVHRGESCQNPMWMEEKGTSADPADLTVVCSCGKRLPLQALFLPGALGDCRGERPWLLDRDPDKCDEKLKLLHLNTRQLQGRLSHAADSPACAKRVRRFSPDFPRKCGTVADLVHRAITGELDRPSAVAAIGSATFDSICGTRE